MRRKLFIVPAVIALVLAMSPAVLAQETISNDDIISLTKAGLASSVIVNKIRSAKTNFDLSTDALIKLKQSGVGDDVVGAMLEAKVGHTSGVSVSETSAVAAADPNDPMAKHNYGIYLYEEKDGIRKMTQVKPSVSAQNRTGGIFTSQMTYGITKVKTKANLPGPRSALQLTDTIPVFYFYLDITSGGLNTASGIPSDPGEFTLVHFNVRSDNREVTIGKSNAFSGKGGLSDEYVVHFKAEDLGNGIFRISPSESLPKGEYGFYLVNSGNSNASAAVGAKFFDFGVNPVQ
jgi:hypothetical protein